MEFKKKYRRTLFIMSAVGLIVMAVLGYVEIRNSIPDEVKITRGMDELEEVFNNPLVTWRDSIEVSGTDAFTIPCEILDTLFLKNVKVEVVEPICLNACGSAVGIYMETDGVMVVDTQEIEGEDGLYYEPAGNIVQPGDYITAFNSHPLSSKQDLIEEVQKTEGEDASLSLMRAGNPVELAISPVKTSGNDYKLGIWVRDDTQGIGTVTYMDENSSYGALGHGISDIDTGQLIQIKGGDIYTTEIIGIHRGEKGTPGELAGLIRYDTDNVIGTISRNTNNGIFGRINGSRLACREMNVGFKQEMTPGEAAILCSLNGQVEEYSVNIEDINYNDGNENKNFIVQITDERLLKATGGIVQGMSGAPVIQNNKLVGAVTHVFVSDPTRGYGIFIEEMLKAGE